MSSLCIVQFMHPGGEHEPDRNQPTNRSWNCRPRHRRTFIRCRGTYVADGETPKVDDLVFWGEWEPPARIVQSILVVSTGFPQYVCEPYISRPTPVGAQNTDPFVFGDQFLFSICQQNTIHGPTGMQSLASGTVILFGSHKCGHFHLDTVFVVSDGKNYSAENYGMELRDWVRIEYLEAVMEPWHASLVGNPDPKGQGRVYRGTTLRSPVQGMFSFFPCCPSDQTPNGFARPKIHLLDHFTDSLMMGRKLSTLPNLVTARGIWDDVARQVRAAGLQLAVHAELPPVCLP